MSFTVALLGLAMFPVCLCSFYQSFCCLPSLLTYLPVYPLPKLHLPFLAPCLAFHLSTLSLFPNAAVLRHSCGVRDSYLPRKSKPRPSIRRANQSELHIPCSGCQLRAELFAKLHRHTKHISVRGDPWQHHSYVGWQPAYLPAKILLLDTFSPLCKQFCK